MPIPEDRLYQPNRLNRWFAVSSVVMTVSLLWMIGIDYYRPWREYQDSYFVGTAALAHLDYLQANTQDRVQEIEEARQRVRDVRELNQTQAPKIAKAEAELQAADLEFNKTGNAWSREDQTLDVTRDGYEKALNRYGPDHPKTRAAYKELSDGEIVVEDLRKQKELWEDKQTAIHETIKELTKNVTIAEARLAELEKVGADALAKDQAFRGVLTDEGLLGGIPVVRALINAPLLDFAAPKTASARHQVKQLVLPEIRQRLNYLESYTTDRCTTCHVAIDDPAFAQDRLARKLERAIPAINEAMQRRDDAPFDFPPTPVLEGQDASLPPGEVTEHWDLLTKDQQDTYFEALLALFNRYLKSSGRKTIDLGQPLLAHPDLDFYVTVDSPHPMATMGCTVCHEGNPQETDFVLAAHSPPTHEVRSRWEEEHYVRHLGIPNTTFETIEHYWDRPMRLPQYSESGCAKCHGEIADIARFEGKHKGSMINMGRYLFASVGCVNCHVEKGITNPGDASKDPRRVGPALTYVASKLQPEFAQQWIYFPQKFRPSTRMPHFFLQENNRDESATELDPEPELRTETEVAAITKYLFAVSEPWKPIEMPEGVKGDVEGGRDLFKSVGCLACHANIAEFGDEWITTDIASREGIDKQTAHHRFLGMTYEQRVRYAMENFPSQLDSIFDPESARFDPDRELNTPVFTRFAPDLSGIGTKTNAVWLYSWLNEPTHYSAATKMPSLRLTPPEAADITAYLMTLENNDFEQGVFELNRERRRMVDDMVFMVLSALRSERRSRAIMDDEGDELTDMLIELLGSPAGTKPASKIIEHMDVKDKRVMFLGNKMIAHYGCYTCHEIRGFERTTPVGTELTAWAEKPVTQLDFAFYDHAFHDMREDKEDVFGYIYPRDAETLNYWSPIGDRAHEQISLTHAAFAKHKMLNPRIWDREKLKLPFDKLKMPNFYFTEKEAEALTTYLLSRMPPRVGETLKINYDGSLQGPIAKGRHLTRELNCLGCHEIEDNAPTVQQYFRRTVSGEVEFDALNAPPSLWGEGAKVQHNWFHKFLQQVEPLRPWLRVRMPSFTLTGNDATTLVEYFAALSRNDAAKLTETRGPIDEYVLEEIARAGDDPSSEDDAAPGADWFRQDSLERRAGALRRFAVERKLIREFEVDMLNGAPDALRSAHADVLKRIDFMRELYDVAYPFVEPPREMSPQEEFEHGRGFFNNMGCLQCHVLGDMLLGPAKNTDDFVQMYRLDGVRGEGENAVAILNGEPYPIGSVIDGHTLVGAENILYSSGDSETNAYVEGPGPDGETERIMLVSPTAPNLSLTFKRLRRDWVYNWMLEPQWIQPGTKMPQNFPDGVSPFEGDPTYPGTAVDHINLLVDYLYQAGATNERAEIPKLVVSADEEGFDEDDGEFDEEEFDD